MLSGLLPEWEPEPGHTTVWRASDESRTAISVAPVHDAFPSYIQRRHFNDALQSSSEEGQHRSSFAVLSFEIDEAYDAALLEAVFSEHLRRHGTYHTWVWETENGYQGRTIHPHDISLTRVVDSDDSLDIRDVITAELPDITDWDMFLFAATGTENARQDSPEPRFRVIFAVDHFYTDGMSLGIIMYELLTSYRRLLRGKDVDLPNVESYADYCEAEVQHTSELHLGSDDVRGWISFIENASWQLPSFPLPLGLELETRAKGTSTILTEFATADECENFNAVCKRYGANTNSGIMALAGLIHHAATNNPVFSMLTPVSTRLTRAQILSVGWYTRLVPVQYRLDSGVPDFQSAVTAAHAAVRESKKLIHTPLHHVAKLLAPLAPEAVPTGFAAPMISYLDTRSMPGNDLVSRNNMTVHGSVDDSREVFLWVNRTREGMDLNFIHPDTTTACESVAIYAETFCNLFHHIAHGEDTTTSLTKLLADLSRYSPYATNQPEPALVQRL